MKNINHSGILLGVSVLGALVLSAAPTQAQPRPHRAQNEAVSPDDNRVPRNERNERDDDKDARRPPRPQQGAHRGAHAPQNRRNRADFPHFGPRQRPQNERAFEGPRKNFGEPRSDGFRGPHNDSDERRNAFDRPRRDLGNRANELGRRPNDMGSRRDDLGDRTNRLEERFNRGPVGGQTFLGKVTRVRSDKSFDISADGKTYNVYTASGLAGRLKVGDAVRVNGVRQDKNDIRQAVVSPLRR